MKKDTAAYKTHASAWRMANEFCDLLNKTTGPGWTPVVGENQHVGYFYYHAEMHGIQIYPELSPYYVYTGKYCIFNPASAVIIFPPDVYDTPLDAINSYCRKTVERLTEAEAKLSVFIDALTNISETNKPKL